MSRLFVLGCSFTNYAWPTWADMLGTEFEVYENWGYPGLGNQAICERLVELHAREHLTKNDTVIIQWTSHLRNDYHTTDTRREGVLEGVGWKTCGSIFNYINAELYSDEWIKTFWDETSYTMHLLNNIVLAQGLLKSIDCNWYMTSMGELEKMNSDYPDGLKGEVGSTNNIWKDIPPLSMYKDLIANNRWIRPVGTTAWNSKIEHFKFKDLLNTHKFTTDRHPSIDQHAEYLLTQVKPKINNSQDLSKLSRKWIDKVNTIYKNTHKDFENFCETIYKDLPEWQGNRYRGF
jgi:hypothetical protein